VRYHWREGVPAWYRDGEAAEAVGPARGQPWQGITGARSLLRVNPPLPYDPRIGDCGCWGFTGEWDGRSEERAGYRRLRELDRIR
jgi:hypothetical protein